MQQLEVLARRIRLQAIQGRLLVSQLGRNEPLDPLLGLLIALWGFIDPPIGDLNGDGEISAGDLGLLIGNWTICDP